MADPTLTMWESRATLLAHLEDLGRRYVLVGSDAEAPREFYSFSIDEGAGRGLEIGIVATGHGIKPSWILSPDGRWVAIGHDLVVSVVDVVNGRVTAVRELDGVFYEFVGTGSPGEFVVWHEIGVVRMDFSGQQRWSVATDILEACRAQPDGTVLLRQWEDKAALIIDLKTGAWVRA